jgi:hypothetical protein
MVDEVKVKISVDSASAKKALNDIKKESIETGKEVENQGKRLAESLLFKGSIITGSIALLAKGIKTLSDNFGYALDHADRLGKSSFFTGLSTDRLQKIENTLKSYNVSMSSFESSFNNVMKMMNDAKWGKALGDDTMIALNQLSNISGELINPYNARSTAELFDKISNALSKIKDVEQRRRLGALLGFDDQYIYALSRGAVKFDEITALTKEEVAQTQQLNKEIANTEARVNALWEKMSLKLILPLKKAWLGFQERVFGKIVEGAEFIATDPQGFRTDLNTLISSGGVQGNSVKEMISSSLRKMGWTEEGIAGVLGNIGAESSFNPLEFNSAGGGKGAFGLAQWRAERQDNLFKFAKEHGGDPYSAETQFMFMLYEMQEKGIYNQLKYATDRIEAVNLMERKFEKSRGQNMASRYRNAGIIGEEVARAVQAYRDTYNTNSVDSHDTVFNTTNNYNNGMSLEAASGLFGEQI